MTYYTLQKLQAWKDAQNRGYLEGNKQYVDEEISEAYEWMNTQLKKRLRNYNSETPIWLWLEIDNIDFLELMEDEWVLLEVVLDEEDVLISNFDAWHHVLNKWRFGDNGLIPMEQTWEYIFDKDYYESQSYSFEDDCVQGTTGRINVKDIKVLKYIINSI